MRKLYLTFDDLTYMLNRIVETRLPWKYPAKEFKNFRINNDNPYVKEFNPAAVKKVKYIKLSSDEREKIEKSMADILPYDDTIFQYDTITIAVVRYGPWGEGPTYWYVVSDYNWYEALDSSSRVIPRSIQKQFH